MKLSKHKFLIIGPRLIGNNYPKSFSKFGETTEKWLVNDGKSRPTTIEAWFNMDNNSTKISFNSSQGLSGLQDRRVLSCSRAFKSRWRGWFQF